MDIKGSVAIITGAGNGIGEAVAKYFVRNGAKVVIVDMVQKNIDRVVIAWNGVAEAEWEGDGYDDDKGVFGQTLGASYEINPRWLIGAELVHEIEYAGWSDWGDHFVAIGPNVSHRREQFWITATALFQVSDMANESDFQLRTIIGFDF